jgi:uncharacterized membrane protein
MSARVLGITGFLLLAGCDSSDSSHSQPAQCMTGTSADQGRLESWVVLPQLDPREGSPDYLVCTRGSAINASGTVTGETCEYRGFIWSPSMPDGLFVTPYMDDETKEVSTAAVDSDGEVVGALSPRDLVGVIHAFRTSAGRMTLLPPLVEDLSAVAIGMNDRGTIVGQSMPSSDRVAAVYWQDGEIHRIQEVDDLGGSYAGATAVNEDDTIVGFSNTSDVEGIQAFRWTISGSFELLPALLDECVGEPRDVNEAGVMVGRAAVHDDENGTPCWNNRPVYWDEEGNIHELPRIYDTGEVSALAINDRGVIVGYEMTPEFVSTEARVWIDCEVHDLRDLAPDLPEEYRLSSAVDINDSGEVLAQAFVEDGGPIRIVTLVLRLDLDR